MFRLSKIQKSRKKGKKESSKPELWAWETQGTWGVENLTINVAGRGFRLGRYGWQGGQRGQDSSTGRGDPAMAWSTWGEGIIAVNCR